MNLSAEAFVKTVDYKYWKHVTRKSLLPQSISVPNRKDFLNDLAQRIQDMEYAPGVPRGYIVASKAHGVARFIPVLSPSDYCVYYFCSKVLEPKIAFNRTPGTFGGFRLGGALRKKEVEEVSKAEDVLDPDYAPYSSFNRFGWVKAWSEYQTQALLLFQSGDYQCFSMLDIANFYDSVHLDQLENWIFGYACGLEIQGVGV